jgi:hypothetical protein
MFCANACQSLNQMDRFDSNPGHPGVRSAPEIFAENFIGAVNASHHTP